MNFEPCNPPLVDPLLIQLLIKELVKPQSPLVPEPSTKYLPLRPIPIKLTSPERQPSPTPSISRRSPQLGRSPKSSFSPRNTVRSSPYEQRNPGSKPEPRTRKVERHGISEEQGAKLRDWFSRYTYLTLEHRRVVAAETGLPEKTVMYWFQNQRRKVKRTVAAC